MISEQRNRPRSNLRPCFTIGVFDPGRARYATQLNPALFGDSTDYAEAPECAGSRVANGPYYHGSGGPTLSL